jgi:ferredoxin-type protein NapG
MLAGRWISPFRSRDSSTRGASPFRPGGLIRPPTASADDAAFRRSCIRCGLCGTACKSGCIRYFGLDEPEHGAFTPYIDVRDRSCVLCMRCTQVCPTGALTAVAEDLESIVEHVDMGTAVVDPDRCLSYQGRICGYCYDACPLPSVAIRLVPKAKPVVVADGCVGCGRCVELCPQSPTALDVRRLA